MTEERFIPYTSGPFATQESREEARRQPQLIDIETKKAEIAARIQAKRLNPDPMILSFTPTQVTEMLIDYMSKNGIDITENNLGETQNITSEVRPRGRDRDLEAVYLFQIERKPS